MRSQTILSQFGRLPGFASSSTGLSIVMGTDEDIDWGDVMNRPENSVVQVSALQQMEARFAPAKRRVF
jgi:hypothetical protein